MRQLSGSESVFSLSHAQRRIWMMEQHYPDTSLNNVTLYFIFKGEANLEWIETAIHCNLSNHTGFGLRFTRSQDGEPYQYYIPHRKTPLPMIDFSPLDNPDEAFQLWTQEQAATPFQLENGPLYYVALFKIRENECGYLIKAHHIIADGWSGYVLHQDTLEIYEKLAKGEERPAGRSSNFLDFADDEEHYLASNRYIKDKQFWLQRYHDFESPTTMGTSKAGTNDSAGTRRSFRLNKVLSDQVREKLSENRVSLNAWFVSLMLVYLYRTTGQSDLVIGTPVVNRSGPKEKSAIGMFVSTMPLRVQMKAIQSFDSFSREVQRELMSCYFHQKYPYDNLVQELELRKKGTDQLFSVVVNNYGTRLVTNLENLTVSANEVYSGHQYYPFQFIVRDWFETGELELAFDYKADHSDGIVEQIYSSFNVMLQDIIQEPGLMIQDIRLLDEGGTRQLTVGFNDTAAAYPREATIHGLFEAQAEKTPGAVAVVYGDQQLTYAELNAQANQLAWTLRGHGVGPERIVAILMERSLEMVVGMLGILKAGGAYVPIDPDYPAERIAYTLRDSGAEWLVTTRAAELRTPALPFTGCRVYAGESVPEQTENPPQTATPEQLAYVIYTSGTTGKPKGTMITHRNVVRLLFNDRMAFDFNERDVWTLFHSYCFDFSVWEMYGALLYGGKLVVVPLMTARDPEQMLRLLRQERVTVLNQTPSAFYALSQREMEEADAELCVRTVIFGGEALAPGRLRSWQRKYPDTDLINMYGITETTVHVTYKKLGEAEITSGISNIGKPLPTLRAYILGEGQQLQPVGVAGELCIAGEGLARGYLNNPELTAEKFVDNPFEPGARMYRTGDLARWLPDGNLEYLGRIDHQVKIRGYRIECGEIEARLLAHASIREAVVIDRKDEQGQAYLCAYCVSNEAVAVPELRSHLAGQLPDYMIPSYFVELEQLPLNTNGKVDRKALPVPEAAQTGSVYEAPSTPAQLKLAEIWQDVLGAEQVGIHDNFFVLGGDSIKAIRLVSRINRDLDVTLPLKELYLHQTIGELAGLLVQEHKPNRQLESGQEMLERMKRRIMEDPEQAKHLPEDYEDVYPLSKIQQSMVFYSRLRLEEPIYHDQFLYHFKIVSTDRLAETLQRLSDKHPILRTTFDLTHFEEEVQIVHTRITPNLLSEDISSLSHEAQERVIQAYIEQDKQSLFRFDKEVLWRVHLFRLDPQDNYCMVATIHHAMLDGWSLASLQQEAVDLYRQLLQGKPVESQALQSSYRDYVAINRFRESDEESRQYWIRELAGYTRNKLPFNYAGKKREQGGVSKIYRRPLSRTLLESLERQAKRYRCTVKELCLSAYVYLLGILTTEEEIVTGVVSHDRPAMEDADKVLGCFLNTVPLRTGVTGQVSKWELVSRTKQQLAQMKAYELSLAEIAHLIGEVSNLSVNPVFDTLFNYTDFHVLEEMRTGQERAWETASLSLDGNEMTNTLFDLEIFQALQNLYMQIKYAPGYFDDREIETAFAWYERILEALCDEESDLLSMEHLMTSAERQDLAYEWNRTDVPYATEKTLHQLVEEQAARTPDAVAVVYLDQQLTYAELNTRANQLARMLRGQGVGPDGIVAMMAEPSLELIYGMLGILKAGGAYLPIDPSLPAERVRYMLSDSGAAVLLLGPGLDVCGFEGAVVELTPGEQGQSGANLPLELDSRRMVYMIYTSGTTGNPKGVMIEHRSVVNFITGMMQVIPFAPAKSILFATTLSFDISVVETLLALTQGMRVVAASKEQQKDPQQLAELIGRQRIGMVQMTPSRVKMLLSAGCDAWLEGVTEILIGGEAWTGELLTELQSKSKAALFNMYGPTETTIWSAVREVTAEQTVTVGGPMANTQLYIVNDKRQLQPVGVAGELCIAGDGLARGYYNRPELTAEKFVDNPFGPGMRMYRTGDLARWLPDGSLEYLGRIDHQVKIRGYRIECGEIEARLLAHASVREAVVMAREDEQGHAYLCAYLVSDAAVAVPELRAHLAIQLPDYMIPSYFLELERIPLNNNGKVDRKALPAPDREAYTEGCEAPRDVLETQLAALFAVVLGVNEVGISDSFFERGGHSLKAVALVSRIHQQLGVELPLRELFARPTVKALAAHVRSAEQSGYGRIEPAAVQASYPLSSAQRRLYVLHELEPESTRYNMPGVVELAGKVDMERLEQAIRAVIARHESLRTSFTWVDGEPRQQIHEEVPFELVLQEAEESRAQEFTRSFVRPFALDEAPLLRAGLLRLAEERYWLVWDMHHIVSDGVSMNILVSDFMAAYAGEELAPLRIQYKDYAVWQQNTLEVERMQAHEAYWLSAYAEEAPVLELPADRLRPAVPGSEGGKVHAQIRADVAEGLERIAAETGATLYMVLLAAYNVWLHKYTGQNDIVVGTPVSGRTHGDTEAMIGMFVNTLALRNAPSGEKRFIDFVREVKERTLSAFEHQDYPFEELVEKLNVRRDMGHNPLFDTMLVLQNMEQAGFRLADVDVRGVELSHSATKFDLTLNAVEQDQGLQLTLEYSRALFNGETAERYLLHFEQLLSQIAGQPEASIGAYELVTPAEKEQLVYGFNDTAAAYPREATIHGLFEAQVEKTPGAVAVVYGDQQLTYAELNAQANQLAWTLRGHGVGPERIVAILMERSLEMVVGMLGILKAGGAYVPIDPDYPAERITYTLRDSGAEWLVTTRAAELRTPALPFAGCRVYAGESVPEQTGNPPQTATPEQLAYVIYTSGTTGKPKGTMITHRNVVRLLFNDRMAFDFNERDVWTLFHSYCFDFSVWEMYGALLYGGKLVVVPLMTARDPEQMVRLLRQERVTVLNQTPSAFYALSQREMEEADAELCVRTVIFGGEALAPGRLRSWQRKYPDTDLINMYGITETTVHVTYKKLGEAEITSGISNIGKPLPTLRAYILGEGQQLQPVGVTGELCIAGEGLARGYLNNPELTGEKFVDNPFEPGARMYRTGDLARWLPDGNLEYLGRIDHQVKIRGYRIECGEIEARLLAHASIREAVVLAREDEQGQAYLCAYYVSDEAVAVPELRSHLAGQLPDYMIPSYFMELEQLPLSTNGKVDRKALPVPEAAQTGSVYEAPSTPAQLRLAEIWQDVLGAEQVGIHDNFFVLGGDSIKAIRLVSRINRDLDVTLPLKELYLHQTIGELAGFLSQEGKAERQLELGREMLEQMKRRITEDPDQARHLPEDYEDVYPLSKIQQSMVFYSRLRPEEPIYHDQFLYHFKIVSTDRLAEALQRLSDKHPILRTTFDLTHFEEEVQIVHTRITPNLLSEDISSISHEAQERVIQAYIEQDKQSLFRFDEEVLWRVRLFRLNTHNDYCMVSTIHHAVLDGWSLASFQQEAMDIYQQLLQGKPVETQALQSSYRDYVAINRFRESDEESRQYWIRELAGYTRNKLPFNYAGKRRERGAVSKIYRRPLSRTLLGSLKRQAKRYGCTVKELCLSAHVYLLGILTTEEEIVTGVVSHDRPAMEDADKVLGCFLNTVPLRIGVTGQVSKSELVSRTKQQLAQMKAHELFLVDIAHLIGEVSSPSVNPVFDTLFNYTDFHVLEERPGEELVSEPVHFNLEANEMTNTWFDLEVSQSLQELNMQIKYAPGYFDDREIETAFAWYERILEALCDEESDLLSMEHLMTSAERHGIVYEWNRTGTPYAAEKTLHQLVEEQAARTPERPALSWKSQKLTYRELDERSNRLARRLQARGVKVNDHVGLMTGRSFEMIIGMLAILKAGAAYVPIDPDYPQSRIAHIIGHAGVSILVVDQTYEGAPMQVVDSRDPSLIEHSGGALQLAKDSKELAYIIYTSGSTGEPKGVMIEHHSAVNLVSWVNQEFSVHEEDRLLFITSMCFDLSVYDIFGPLAAGAQIVIASREQVQDPKQMQRLLEQEAITIWDSVPTTLNHVLHSIEEQEEAFSQKALRLALVSGDWIPTDLAERAKAYFPHVQVIGLGGATEATVWSNYYPIEKVPADLTSIPYGKPLANNTFYILDADWHPVPYGVAGELYIGGVGVARGYLNDPAKTSASFLENPFVPQGRIYRTGDMGRMLPDGNMEFLGRQDHQVKIRGYRVELGEIENQLLRHEMVREAVVAAREDAAGGKYLCAYVVLQQETATADIREHLGRTLPAYMIPGYVIPMERLPLTPNGKLDRKALPEPDTRMHSEEQYEAPSTETERKLLNIWRDVLGLENIGVSDDFFAVGGHSLRATALVSKIQKTMNVELTLQEVFLLSTIKEQAQKMEGMLKTAYSSIEPTSLDKDYPLSSAQRRLYVLHELEPESTRYNMPGVVELAGQVDTGRLEQAILAVIARHESLRTSFTWVDGEPRQHIHGEAPFELVLQEAEESRAQEFTRSFVRPFALDEAPLLRAGLLRLAEERYWLVWDMHHIVSDGVSMNILVSDFMAAYAGEELAPLRIQYKDYAVWQQGVLEVERMQAHEAYWLSAYAEEAPVLELPADRLRPAVPGSEGGKVHAQIRAELAEGLKRIAAETGATLYMVLLAAYNVWLHKYTGQSDIVVGTPVSGRTHGDTGPMIGMFVNTLALRNAPSGDKRFINFVREVKERTLAAFEHQDYPFEELVEKLNVRREMGRNPLFDTMLVLQNMEQARFRLADVDVRAVELSDSATKFDLTLNVVEKEQGLQLTLEYSRALFNGETAERYLMHFEQLLSQIAGQPEASIGAYTLVTAEEKVQLLQGFNDTAAAYPREATIHGLFEAQAEKTPDAVAVVYGDQQLTYAELNARANQLAWTLRGQGVGPDHIVAVMAERSLELMIGLYGILKAGGAYLPIDPALPAERIRYMLSDSGAAVLLIQPGLDACGFEGVVVGLTLERLVQSEANPPLEMDSRGLAYVIYTSGTTGNPKGVMIEHRAVINRLQWMQNRYPIGAQDVLLQKTPITFDVSVWELFWWGMTGARVCMLAPQGEKDPEVLAETIERYGVTVMHFVPSMLSVFLEQAGQGFGREQLGSLRRVFASGEALKPQHVTGFYKVMQGSGATLHNLYGPTEATVDVTYYDSASTFAETAVPIGKPIGNTQLYIVNSAYQLQPVGVAGELCIAGDGLARGYYNRPELTAEKFVDNPFGPGTRMYRTGDLARWQPDGNLEYLGRIDHQVKIRGYRIECGEIEVRLLAHASIREAVVLACEDEQGQAYLCAYYVSSEAVAVPELRSHMAIQLPDYMIPSYFVELERIPLNTNGKVDRKALPAPDREAYTEGYEAPRDALEIQLSELFAVVLGVNEVGISDSFFERGGHSLKAVALVSRIHQQLGVELPLRELFARPTVKALAAHVRSAEQSGYGRIEPAAVQASYPLSSAQRRLYVLHELEPESTRYNMPGVVELAGKVDMERLEQAIRAVIARHESLRTSFRWTDGEPRQLVHEEVPFGWSCRDVEEAQAREFTRSFVRPFALDEAPLLRAGVLRLAEERYWLVWDMHHIVSDGVSMNILVSDFMAAYAGEELAPLRIQYKDFAVWQQGTLEVERMQAHEAYWLSAYAEEAPVLELPADRLRPAVPSSEGGRIHTEVNAKMLDALKRIAAETGATLYMVLLAAYNVWLHKYTGQSDIVVGTPVSGRTHGDTEPMIGMFVNTLALRNAPSGEKRFIDFVREVKKRTLSAFEHQDYPFEELVEKLNVRRDMGRNPLFDTMLVLQNMEQASFGLTDIDVRPVELGHSTAKFDLTLNVWEAEKNLLLTLEYSSVLFNKETAERQLSHFVHLLTQMTEQADATIASLELITLEEKEQLLYGFNDTSAAYPREATIHGLFEAQAEKTPDAIAVVHGDQQLSYAELNARANQLAWTLRGYGVGPERTVAIMAERSLELMIGVLGILKAGGAYVPIDPAYSAERIAYMLEDSGAGLLLISGDTQVPAAYAGEVLTLNTAQHAGNPENVPVVSGPENMAYVIYTSGSTGQPKGVVITQQNLVNYISWACKVYVQGDPLDFPLYSSVAFDLTVTSMFTPLVSGNRVVIYSGQDIVLVLERMLTENQVGIVKLTPTHLSLLGEIPAAGSNLKRIIVGGEQLEAHVARKFASRCAFPVEIYNEYGPTETTVGCMIYRYDESQGGMYAVPIGIPADNAKVYVLDASRRPVATGVPGEMYIGGEGLARGYLNRPELTAEKFVANPFEPGTRMYRTGDLARWLADGNLEYLGRIDQQVKIRGYRIECGEIEARLLTHASIREAVVIGRKDEQGQAYLCAYVVSDKAAKAPELRSHLAGQLPDYMIPSYFVELEQLPLNTNGKVDRKVLPEPEAAYTSRVYEAPRTAREALLASVWQEVLGVKRLGIKDSFFELGGDSIKAVQIAARLRGHQLHLAIRDLFRYPTVLELSPHVQTLTRQTDQGPVEGEVRLTPIQQGLFERSAQLPHHYNQAVMLYRRDGFDEAILGRVFEGIVSHHDALRMRYRKEAEGIVQWNGGLAEAGFSLDVIDLHAEPDVETRIAAEAERLQRGLHLEQGPLLRLGLMKTGEGDHLLIIIHHLVVDGVSWRILFEDMQTGYEQAERGGEIRFPEKTDAFRTWSEALSRYADSKEQLGEIAYWKQIEQTPAGVLPEEEGPGESDRSGGAVTIELSQEETDQLLNQAGRAYHTEINDILLTGLGLALREWSGGRQFVVDLEGHGREEIGEAVDVSRTVGWFTAVVPTLLDLGASEALSDCIKTVKEGLRSVPNKGLGYGVLKYMTAAEHKGELKFDLRPEICFNYLGQFDQDVTGGVFEASEYGTGSSMDPNLQSEYKLSLNGMVSGGKLMFTCDYAADTYRRATVERWMACYAEQLRRLIAHCTGQAYSEKTASDFSSSGLDIEEIENIYTLLEQMN